MKLIAFISFLFCLNAHAFLSSLPPASPPAGTNEQIQFNNNGSFGGFGSWDGTTETVPGNIAATGTFNLQDGNSLNWSGGSQILASGSNLILNATSFGGVYTEGNTLDNGYGGAQFGLWLFDGGDDLSDSYGSLTSGTVTATTFQLPTGGSVYDDGAGGVIINGNTSVDNVGNVTIGNNLYLPYGSVDSSTFISNNYYLTSGGGVYDDGAGGVYIQDENFNNTIHVGEASSPGALGFFNGTPVAPQTGDACSALQNYSLVSSCGYSAANITGFINASIITGTINPSVTMTSNTTATATFNTSKNDETIYDTSSSLITALTIALPSTTRSGQILRYISNRTVTTTTVTGTVVVGASPTLAANSSVAWQAVNTSGSFVRIQ
jgi:hypothetical protein